MSDGGETPMSNVPEATPQRTQIELDLDASAVSALRREAAKRDVPLRYFLNNLIDIIATDHLATAILDDGRGD
jgi:hypothetical protein